MKSIPSFVWPLCMLAGSVFAQIDLRTEIPHRVYIPYEPIRMTLFVANTTPSDIPFGAGDSSINVSFDIKDQNGHHVMPRDSSAITAPRMLPGVTNVVFTNSLTRIFPAFSSGPYTIQARLDYAGKSFVGAKHFVDIVNGLEVGRMQAVVPGDGSTRTYTLLRVNRGRTENVILRIDDEPNRYSYGVISLGRILNMGEPQMLLDRLSNIHVLFQSAPRVHEYRAYSPMGVLLEQEQVVSDYNTVKLIYDDSGSVNLDRQPTAGPRRPPVMRSSIEGQEPVRVRDEE